MIRNIIEKFLPTICIGSAISLITIYLLGYLTIKIEFAGLTVLILSFSPAIIIFLVLTITNSLGLRSYYATNKNKYLYEFLCLFVGNFIIITILDSFYFYLLDDSLSIAYGNATLVFYDEVSNSPNNESIAEIQGIKNTPLLFSTIIFNIPTILLSSFIVSKMKLKKYIKNNEEFDNQQEN
jgi:hypothetical protein